MQNDTKANDNYYIEIQIDGTQPINYHNDIDTKRNENHKQTHT
jgi:hypothetical protein